jgi:hypothetical protein
MNTEPWIGFADGPPDQDAVEANEELQYLLEQAMRQCLTRGVELRHVRLLCQQTGIDYGRITGES